MSTPQMSEGQLRDVLARVVPEPPDSVADPSPVIRAARVRRRAQLVVATGAVAVVAVAGVLGGRALTDDDSSRQVVDEPSLSADPYAAVPCPEALPDNRPLPDLREVTAVRYCAAGFNGFPAQPGPPDALVYGIDDFASALSATPDADPARCAAVDVVSSNSRLAFQLADGSLTFAPVTMCADVDTGDRTIDGAELRQVFFAALDSQRHAVDYSADAGGTLGCDTPANTGPAEPGQERLTGAVICPSDQPGDGEAIVGDGLQSLDDAWSAGTSQTAEDSCVRPTPNSFVLATTDRGDVVRLEATSCGFLLFTGWELGQPQFLVRFDVSQLSAS